MASPVDNTVLDKLAALSDQTSNAFRELLIARNVATVIGYEFEETKLLDEYGRLKIWVEQTGAGLRERGSLDESLRDDPDLREAVANAFQQLQVQITMAIDLARAGDFGVSRYDQEAVEYLISDSETSDDEQPGDTTAHGRPRISKFSLLVSYISEQIGLLYHYSALFRRPRLGGRYLHSAAIDPAPAVPYYEFSHVRQKLEGWNRRGDDGQKESMISEASTGDSNPHLNSEEEAPTSEVLYMRLAAANTRRREQLRYWSHHPFTTGPPLESFMKDNVQNETQSLAADSEAHSRRSYPTVRTFSSVAQSAIFETATAAGPSRTVYAESVAGDDRAHKRIPKVPEQSKGSLTFECPYCRMMLESAPMQDRMTWKRHIYRDLRPYVCTFAKCPNPDKLYATRRDWMYHEMQMHRRQWNCRLCTASFDDKDRMSSHVKQSHSQSWEQNHLSILLEICEGPMDETKSQMCPFCHQKYFVKKLMEHVAGHLEELALFVLPHQTDEPLEKESSGALSSMNSIEDDIFYTEETEHAARLTATPSTWLSAPTPSLAPTLSVEPGSKIGESSGSWTTVALICEECGRSFDQIHKLNHHRRYHERPHECTVTGCGKRFGSKTHLDRHIQDKHVKSRRFHCSEPSCAYSKEGGKAFPRKDNLRRHMQNKHNKDVWGEDIPEELIETPNQ